MRTYGLVEGSLLLALVYVDVELTPVDLSIVAAIEYAYHWLNGV